MRSRRWGRTVTAALVLVTFGALAACGANAKPPTAAARSVVRVPGDFASVADAAKHVARNGLILVSPGTYRESVTILTPGVTIRGLDRNKTVFDGGGTLSDGIVGAATGVSVENLTVRHYAFNGILITGVVDKNGQGLGKGSDSYQPINPKDYPLMPGFAVRYVNSIGNGLYGIYAFNRTAGVIEHTYTAGSADSGIYVGQCVDCSIVVRDNVAEYNAVGFENTNASGSVVVTGNRFTHNRVGLTVDSDYQEAYPPQRHGVIVGNVIADNNAADSPVQADGGFGLGVGLAGTTGVSVVRNRITGNRFAGLALSPVADLASVDNQVDGNVLSGNGVDLAYWSTAQVAGARNCLRVDATATTYPHPLPPSLRCQPGPPTTIAPLPNPVAPAGVVSTDVVGATNLPQLPGDPTTLPYPPATGVALPDVAAISVPPADLLHDETR